MSSYDIINNDKSRPKYIFTHATPQMIHMHTHTHTRSNRVNTAPKGPSPKIHPNRDDCHISTILLGYYIINEHRSQPQEVDKIKNDISWLRIYILILGSIVIVRDLWNVPNSDA